MVSQNVPVERDNQKGEYGGKGHSVIEEDPDSTHDPTEWPVTLGGMMEGVVIEN